LRGDEATIGSMMDLSTPHHRAPYPSKYNRGADYRVIGAQEVIATQAAERLSDLKRRAKKKREERDEREIGN